MRQVDRDVERIRAFNRFYTRRIGALGHGHLGSTLSLTEVRVLYEIAHRDGVTASDLATDLALDKGQLSRMLAAFRRRRLVRAVAAAGDRRRAHLHLTTAGRRAFASLDSRAHDEIVEMIEPLDAERRRRVVAAMESIRGALDDPSYEQVNRPIRLRDPRPGDIGWVVHRHGVLYAEEYGWGMEFEALVARVAGEFVEHFDGARERCWIAERDGEIVGSVFVVAKSPRVAKLRLLLVEPSARGQGLGKRLVDEVIRFARAAGYEKVELWTQDNLAAARAIYASRGFRMVAKERNEMLASTSETWELVL